MSEKILREALEIARKYVASLHDTIKSATGMHDNLVLPDLEKIDAALGAVPEGAGKADCLLCNGSRRIIQYHKWIPCPKCSTGAAGAGEAGAGV